MSSWASEKVLVIGCTGFLGSYVVLILHRDRASITAPRSADCDLRNLRFYFESGSS